MMSVDGVGGDMNVGKNSTTSIVGAGRPTECDVTIKSLLLLLLLLLSLFTQRQAFFSTNYHCSDFLGLSTSNTSCCCCCCCCSARLCGGSCIHLPCALKLLLLILL
jgi:hypothetical protein